MNTPMSPYHSELPTGRDGFTKVLRSEWTKLRTVRGWIVGLVVGALVMIGLGLLTAAGSRRECSSVEPGNPSVPIACAGAGPAGPDGEAVTDDASFVHQAVSGDGSITARVTSLTGMILAPDPNAAPTVGTQPWAKAGLVVRASLQPGSAYAAVMATGGHGVRMQYNFIHDKAGPAATISAAAPQWLRLTRVGSTISALASVDGQHWVTIGTVHLSGLSSTIEVGMFVASPDFETTTQRLGGSSTSGGPTIATATFDDVALENGWSPQAWTADATRRRPNAAQVPTAPIDPTATTFSFKGMGDLAPATAGPGGDLVERSLVGSFAAMIAMIVVAVGFMTAEYRRGLIRTTLAASPRRGRVVVAKATVIGAVTFVVGLVASAAAFWVVAPVRRRNNVVTLPVPTHTEVRLVIGTAALLAVAAVLAMAIGTILRRGAGAVAATIAFVVVPYILSVAAVLPAAAANWLLRLSPAAAFAIQQSTVHYAQVPGTYTPTQGYFPLTPLAGFVVLVGWTALALGLAVVLIRRRDA